MDDSTCSWLLSLGAVCVLAILAVAVVALQRRCGHCRRGARAADGFRTGVRRGSLSGTNWGYGSAPACDDCRGLTTSAEMPAIEPTVGFGNGLCCGRLGIPP